MNTRLIFSLLGLFSFLFAGAQSDTLKVQNGSFEDRPHAGGAADFGIKKWFDCGRVNFRGATPPDIHPKEFWGNTIPASHGKTYLGMVTRDNESWEAVSQRLEMPMQMGTCYTLSIELCQSPKYISKTLKSGKDQNFTTPIVLRVWGGSGHCNERQLLSESIPINHEDWKTYVFEFEAMFPNRYIVVEAFYKTPTVFPYNGHLLIDNLSDIVVIPCPDQPLLAIAYPKVDPQKKLVPAHKRKKKKPKKKKASPSPSKDIAVAAVTKPAKKTVQKKTKDRILKKLDKSTLKTGQIINIEKLYFEADTSSINEDSYGVLDEVYDFLNENKGVYVEIGGHTNSTPPDWFCDKLSTARAKEVAAYLIRQGIRTNRVKFKGYGRRKPIASNKTKNGRQRNQRVEVKILSMDG